MDTHISGRWARALTSDEATAREAKSELAGAYWYPAYAFFRASGVEGEGAATLTESVLTRMIEDPVSGTPLLREWMLDLAKAALADPTPRTPLLTVDREWSEQRFAGEGTHSPEETFVRRWTLDLLEQAVTTLQAEYEAAGKGQVFAAAQSFLGYTGGADGSEPYAGLSATLGVSDGAGRTMVFELRKRYREVLHTAVADTVATEEQIASELQSLLIHLPTSAQTVAPSPALGRLDPEQLLARGMNSVQMSTAGGLGWTPPTIAEAARLFPGYEVVGMLGHGGMGAVYQARQQSLDRLVALKLLPLEISVDPSFADRFRREARAMAKLNHPNIIAVHDFGQTSEGHLFFAMEFVEGASLHELVHKRAGGLPPTDALGIIEQVCEALSYAHEQGIVHRDIKPANVMIDGRGRAKIADFGLARINDPTAEQWGQTMTGVIMGTPDYMAPEQKRGMQVDSRADIYSVGVMFYEMLCGETPQGAFELPSQRCGLPKELDAVVTRAIAPQVEKRFQTTTELKQAVATAKPSVLRSVARKSQAAAARQPAAVPMVPIVKAAPVAKGKPLVLWGSIAAGVILVAVAGTMLFGPKKKNASNTGPKVATKASVPTPSASAATPFPNPGAKPATATAASTAARPVGTIDLLAGVNVQRDSLFQTWRLEGGVLKSPLNTGSQETIMLPTPNVPANYDLRYRITREKPGFAVRFFFVQGDGGGSVNCDGTDRGDADIRGFSQRAAVEKGGGKFFKTGATSEVLIQVRESSVTALLDGQMVVRAEGRASKNGQDHKDFNPPASDKAPSIGLSHSGGPLIVHEATLVPVTAGNEPARLAKEGGANLDPAAPAPALASAKPASATPIAAAVQPGKAVDLLALVDVKRDASKGEWARAAGGVVSKKSDIFPILEIEQSAPVEYDFEIEFTIAEGAREVSQALAVPGGTVFWQMGYGAGDQTFFCFGPYLDGKKPDTRPEALLKRARLNSGQRYRSLVEVRKDSLRALIDGQEVLKWSGDFKRFGNPADYCKFKDTTHLGLASFKSDVTFHKAELRPFTAAAAATLVSATPSDRPPAGPVEPAVTNSLGMKFVPVPITGGPTNGQRVLFSIWETRVQDYEAFAKETKREWPKTTFAQEPTHPAVNMTWEDAQAFGVWLTEREQKAGKLRAGDVYRMPSDHEWSCAVGIGELEDAAKTPKEKHLVVSEYPWGSDVLPPPDNAGNYGSAEIRTLAEFASSKQVLDTRHDGFAATSPVGKYPANRFGLYDLGGNAAERCDDWMRADQKTRSVRGQSWEWNDNNGDNKDFLSSARHGVPPSYRGGGLGFRLVFVPGPQTLAAESAAAAPKVQTEMEKWLAQVDGPQQESYQREVMKPFEAGLAELQKGYLGALDSRIATASTAGQLDVALGWRNELQRFREAGQAVPADDADLATVAAPLVAKALPPLRTQFRTHKAKLDADRLARAKAAFAKYDAVLAPNITLLTQRQRLDDALLLKTKRDEVQKAWLPAPEAPAAASPAQQTSGTFASATKDAPLVNSLGMKFVPVPGTEVLFCIHETRYKDYAAYAAEVPGVATTWKNQSYGGFAITERNEDHPATQVSWEDAQAFCAWLSKKEGKTYRLPTDEEWSIAVGLGRAEKRSKGTTPAMLSQKENTEFPWGGEFPPKTKDKAGNYSDESGKAKAPNRSAQYLDGYDDGFPTTAPVMSYKPNKLGLYDLGGNVWEWCEDWYDNAQKDRVLRGASWNRHDRGTLLSSFRGPPPPGDRFINYGFRCVVGMSAR